jgi:hypothetical protein
MTLTQNRRRFLLERTSGRLLVMAVAMATGPACSSSVQQTASPVASVSMTSVTDVREVLYKQFPLERRETIDSLTVIDGFNDSQALADDGNVDLGPLARLYIVPVRYADTTFDDQWKLSAILDIDGMSSMPKSYKNLGIRDNPLPALYCVYLMHRMTGNKWIGSIAPVASEDCTNPDSGKQLNVGQELEPGTSKADFPSVVRFDEDKNGKALIGVTCGEKAWCEIGRNPGNGDRRPPVHSGVAGETRKHRIKSWHDEQEITTPDTLPTQIVLRRVVRASITPDENLGGYTILDFQASGGATVASIYLDSAPPANSKYAKWGLKSGNNTLTLFSRYDPATGREDWWAVFRDSTGSPGKEFEVTRMTHNIKPPAVARWKWNPGDEDIWVACEQGCCTVSGFAAKLFGGSPTPKKEP